MVAIQRWVRRIDEIIRSRHYTWIAEGLGGNEVPEAVHQLLTDTMHLSRRAGLNWDEVYAAARQQFEREEREAAESTSVDSPDAAALD